MSDQVVTERKPEVVAPCPRCGSIVTTVMPCVSCELKDKEIEDLNKRIDHLVECLERDQDEIDRMLEDRKALNERQNAIIRELKKLDETKSSAPPKVWVKLPNNFGVRHPQGYIASRPGKDDCDWHWVEVEVIGAQSCPKCEHLQTEIKEWKEKWRKAQDELFEALSCFED